MVVVAFTRHRVRIRHRVDTQQLAVDQFLGNDLAHVAVAITANHVAIQWEVLKTILAHEDQSVAADDQVLEGLVNNDTITRCSDLVHDHPLHFGEGKVKLAPNFHRKLFTQLVITDLQFEEGCLRRQKSKHQLCSQSHD